MNEGTFSNEYIVTKKMYRSWVMMSFLSGKNLLIHALLLMGGVPCLVIFLVQLINPALFYPEVPPDTVYFDSLSFILAFLSLFMLIENFVFRPGHLYRKAVRQSETPFLKYRINFDSDLIRVDTCGDTFRRSYGKISRIKEFKDRAYIGFSDNGGLWLYKDSFTSGDWDACREMIESKRHQTL